MGNSTSFTYHVACLCFESISTIVAGEPGEFYNCFVFSECFSIRMGKPNNKTKLVVFIWKVAFLSSAIREFHKMRTSLGRSPIT